MRDFRNMRWRMHFTPIPLRINFRTISLYFFFICFIFLLSSLVIQSFFVGATFIASSNIQYCTNDGKTPLNCTKKLVVALSIDANQLEGVERVDFVRFATDETQKHPKQVAFYPIKITVSRTPVYYRYPLFFVKPFNAKPYEEVIGGSLLSPCNDNFDKAATCGLLEQKGKPIRYSQGFCCNCDACQTLGMCSSKARSQRSCDIFGQFTTASCLRRGEIWYDGYTIGPHLTDYTINVTLSKPYVSTTLVKGSLPNKIESSLLLTPENPVASSEEFGAIAIVVGDLLPDSEPLNPTQSMFFAPLARGGGERVYRGEDEWMILDKSLVTLDGRACDKVGVEYEAFATQPDACRKAVGSCLSNQLDDYRTMDLKAIASGEKGRYMALLLGDFLMEYIKNNETSKMMPYLTYTVTSPPSTMITLTLSADDLRYIISVASGTILSAIVTQEEVVSNSKDAELVVEVKNTGTIASRFAVSVECAQNIFPILAQVISLSPSEIRELHFKLYVQSVSETKRSTCKVTLKNSEGHVEGQKIIEFKTKEINRDEAMLEGDNGSGREGTRPASAHGEYDSVGILKPLCTLWGTITGKVKEIFGGTFEIVLNCIVLFFLTVLLCSCLCSSCSEPRTNPYLSR